MNDLIIKDQLTEVDESKAAEIEADFAPMVKMLKSFEEQYSAVMAMEQSDDKCKKAKRLRLDIAKVRIEADKLRKVKKERYLRAGNAIQGVYNILKDAVADREAALKEVETYYDRIEEERIQKLHGERVKTLMEFDVDGSPMDLGNMADDVWENFLAGIRTNHEAKVEAERKAEERRAAEEKLQAQYQQRRDALAPYSRFGALEYLSKETTEEAFLETLQLMKAKEQEETNEQERIRLENEKLRKEKDAREAQEREKAAARQKAETATDREKLNGWADSLERNLNSLASDFAKDAGRRACTVLRDAAASLEAVVA